MGFLFRKEKQAPTISYDAYDQTPIPPGFIEYMKEIGQYNPALRNRDEAIGYILADADNRTKAMLYAYAVDCTRHRRAIGNINKSRNCRKYEAFAEEAIRSPEFLRSMERMGTWSFWEPSQGTNAYKLAAKWFP